MLINLRKSAGSWVVKGFLILLAASFAGWGVNDIFTPDPNAAVIKVGEREISIGEFYNAYQRNHQQASTRLSRTITPEEAKRLGLVDITTNQLVDTALLDETGRTMNLLVSDSVVAKSIRSNPAFQNTHGLFDANIYNFALQNAGLTTDAYEEQHRIEIRRQQILTSISAGVGVPRSLVDTFYQRRTERRIAETVTIPLVPSGRIEEPSSTTLAGHYADNIKKFYAPEYRSVTYITLTPEDLINEVQVSEIELREEFEHRFEELHEPETRKIKQMLFAQVDIANSALRQLQSGKEFSLVAQELMATNADSLSLGTLKRMDLPQEARDIVFALFENDISPVIQTEFGWHIYHLVKIIPGYEPEFEDVRSEILAEVALNKAADSLYEISNTIDDELAGGASLAEAAARVDLTAHYIDLIDRNGLNQEGERVQNIPTDPEFLDTIFTSVEGMETPITESNEGLTYVLRVERVIPTEPFPFEKIVEIVSKDWSRAQRESVTKKTAAEIVSMVKGGRNFTELANEKGLTLVTSKPFSRFGAEDEFISRELAQLLFSLPIGEIVTAPMSEGNGITIARISDVLSVSVDRKSNDYLNIYDALKESIADDIWRQYRTFLISNLGVEIDQETLETSF